MTQLLTSLAYYCTHTHKHKHFALYMCVLYLNFLVARAICKLFSLFLFFIQFVFSALYSCFFSVLFWRVFCLSACASPTRLGATLVRRTRVSGNGNGNCNGNGKRRVNKHQTNKRQANLTATAQRL